MKQILKIAAPKTVGLIIVYIKFLRLTTSFVYCFNCVYDIRMLVGCMVGHMSKELVVEIGLFFYF